MIVDTHVGKTRSRFGAQRYAKNGDHEPRRPHALNDVRRHLFVLLAGERIQPGAAELLEQLEAQFGWPARHVMAEAAFGHILSTFPGVNESINVQTRNAGRELVNPGKFA
jgi:hypothetical protein